jgi:hypothetical protein
MRLRIGGLFLKMPGRSSCQSELAGTLLLDLNSKCNVRQTTQAVNVCLIITDQRAFNDERDNRIRRRAGR